MATTDEVSASQDIIICPWPGLAVKIPSAVVHQHPIAFALVSLLIFCYFYWPSGQTKSGQDTGRAKLAKGHNVKEVDVHVDVSQIDGPELNVQESNNSNACENSTTHEVPDQHTDQLKGNPHTNPEEPSYLEGLDHRDQQDNELSSNIDGNCLEENKIQRDDQLVPKSDKNTEDDTEIHATNEITSESSGEDSDFPDDVGALHHKHGHKNGHREHHHGGHHDLQDITPREAAEVLTQYSWSALKPWSLHIILLSVIVILVIYSICTSVLLARSIAAEKNDIGLQHDSLQDGVSPAMPHTVGKESPDHYAYSQSQVSPDSNKASSKKTNTKPMIFTPWPGAVIRLPPTGLPWTIGLIPALYFGFRYFSKLNIDWSRWRKWRKQALRVISISVATLVIEQQLFPSSGVGIIQEFLQVVSVTNRLSDAELCRFDIQARDSESIHTSEPAPLTQPPPEYPSPFIGQPPNAQTEYPSEALSPPHGQLPHVPHYNRPPQHPGVQSSHNGQPPNTQPRHEYPSSLNGQPPSVQPPAQQPPVETEFSSPHKFQPPPVPHYSTSQPPPVQQFPAEDLRSLPKAQAPSEALSPPHGRLPRVPHYSRPPQRPAGVQSSHNGQPPNAQPHPG